MNNLTESDIALIQTEFGQVSSKRMYEEASKVKDGTLVELGVYMGASSRLLSANCIKDNNRVYGIDPVPYFRSNNPNYTYLKEDSVAVGKEWDKGPVDLVLFDSVHVKEQVLCELYYWWDLLKEGGTAIFHDTSWKGYVHKEGHPCAGKLTGNTALGYDTYGGINWDTPDKAVDDFFGVSLNTPYRDVTNDKFFKLFEDDFIKVETNYGSLGMTFVKKKKHKCYKGNIPNWEKVLEKQKLLLSYFVTQ